MKISKKIKKYAKGGSTDPIAAEMLKKRAASDTTKMYNRGEAIETINKITRGEIKPRADKAPAVGAGVKKYASVNKGDTTFMSKADFEKRYAKKKDGGKVAKDGKWMQKVSKSIKARGTEGKCTPITKPGCTGKAKALAKTFKKIAAKRKAK
jgi:hypothetical protein